MTRAAAVLRVKEMVDDIGRVALETPLEVVEAMLDVAPDGPRTDEEADVEGYQAHKEERGDQPGRHDGWMDKPLVPIAPLLSSDRSRVAPAAIPREAMPPGLLPLPASRGRRMTPAPRRTALRTRAGA